MRLAALMALPALLLFAAPAAAQTGNADWERCIDRNDTVPNDEAIAGCTAVIESGKYSGRRLAGAYNNRAIYHSRAGNLEPAFADADEATRIDPRYASPYQSRARFYAMRGNHARASEEMRMAAKLDPESPAIQEILCWSLALARLDLPAARAACDTSLRLRPNDSNTLDSRGMVGLRQQRYQDAWNDYDAAFRLDPNAAHALYGRGIAAIRLGRADGRADIERASAMDPDVARQYNGYGERP